MPDTALLDAPELVVHDAFTGLAGTAPFEGVIGVEGLLTGDGRLIAADSLEWATFPLPLRYAEQDFGGHDGAVVVGRIDKVERRDNGDIYAWGVLDLGSKPGRECARLMRGQFLSGVSMDLDSVDSFEANVKVFNEDGTEAASTSGVLVTQEARVRAATLVAIPAFDEARLSLVASMGGDPDKRKVVGHGAFSLAFADEAAENTAFRVGKARERFAISNAIRARQRLAVQAAQFSPRARQLAAMRATAEALGFSPSAKTQAFAFNPLQWRDPANGHWIDMPSIALAKLFEGYDSPDAATQKIQAHATESAKLADAAIRANDLPTAQQNVGLVQDDLNDLGWNGVKPAGMDPAAVQEAEDDLDAVMLANSFETGDTAQVDTGDLQGASFDDPAAGAPAAPATDSVDPGIAALQDNMKHLSDQQVVDLGKKGVVPGSEGDQAVQQELKDRGLTPDGAKLDGSSKAEVGKGTSNPEEDAQRVLDQLKDGDPVTVTDGDGTATDYTYDATDDQFVPTTGDPSNTFLPSTKNVKALTDAGGTITPTAATAGVPGQNAQGEDIGNTAAKAADDAKVTEGLKKLNPTPEEAAASGSTPTRDEITQQQEDMPLGWTELGNDGWVSPDDNHFISQKGDGSGYTLDTIDENDNPVGEPQDFPDRASAVAAAQADGADEPAASGSSAGDGDPTSGANPADALRASWDPAQHGGVSFDDAYFDSASVAAAHQEKNPDATDEQVANHVAAQQAAWQNKGRTEPAKSYEKNVPARLIPVGSEVHAPWTSYQRTPGSRPTNPMKKVGMPVENGGTNPDGTPDTVARYWDGQQWDYVGPDSTFDTGYVQGSKPHKKFDAHNAQAAKIAKARDAVRRTAVPTVTDAPDVNEKPTSQKKASQLTDAELQQEIDGFQGKNVNDLSDAEFDRARELSGERRARAAAAAPAEAPSDPQGEEPPSFNSPDFNPAPDGATATEADLPNPGVDPKALTDEELTDKLSTGQAILNSISDPTSMLPIMSPLYQEAADRGLTVPGVTDGPNGLNPAPTVPETGGTTPDGAPAPTRQVSGSDQALTGDLSDVSGGDLIARARYLMLKGGSSAEIDAIQAELDKRGLSVNGNSDAAASAAAQTANPQ